MEHCDLTRKSRIAENRLIAGVSVNTLCLCTVVTNSTNHADRFELNPAAGPVAGAIAVHALQPKDRAKLRLTTSILDTLAHPLAWPALSEEHGPQGGRSVSL